MSHQQKKGKSDVLASENIIQGVKMKYEKPEVVNTTNEPVAVTMCAGGNKCNGPKDTHVSIM